MAGFDPGPDDALRAEWERLRPPADVVPRNHAQSTNWRHLAARAREGGLRFSYTLMTEDGVVTVTEPVTVAVPEWDRLK